MGNQRRFHLVEDVLKIIKPSSYVDLILSFDFINKTKKGYSIDIDVKEVRVKELNFADYL